MKKYILLTITITSIISILVYTKFFQPRINVGGYVKYGAVQTQQGLYPTEVSAFGVLKLTKDQPDGMNQMFKIDLVNSKLILNEGLIDKNGTIVISTAKILDIISMTETELVAKNEVWAITMTKNSVILTDKDGKGGNLVSGFVGDTEYDLTSY